MNMKLYNFFRSGTSHRTRIAMNLKGLEYEYVAVALGNALRATGDEALRTALQSRAEDASALVREHVAWALEAG
jgi:glutathione S-transferase